MAQPGSHLAPVAGGLKPGESPPRDWQLPCGRESDSFPAMAVTAGRDVESLQAALAASEARAAAAEQQITSLKLMVEKLRRALYGQRSERTVRLLNQLELALDELTADATEDDLAAEQAAAETTEVKGFTRRKPSRKPFPEHLPRERVVVPAPTSCGCCGSERLSKIGEDVTETLEVIPRQWKVIQTIREKFTCRDCEKVSQPPAPFHAVPRGWAGPNLLATIVFEKYGQHQPLNRQRERYAREGVDLSLSTLADQVGACAVALKPLHDLIADHVLAARRLHGDDTPVPVLAKGKTVTGQAWAYVRDDRPFGGPDPPAVLFRYSRDRSGDHPVEHRVAEVGLPPPRRPRKGQAEGRPTSKLRHREKHQGLSHNRRRHARPAGAIPAGRRVSARRDLHVEHRAPRQSDARRNRRSATIKTEKGLAIPAARRNHPSADAARNLILIVARLSPRSSRYTRLTTSSDRFYRKPKMGPWVLNRRRWYNSPA